MGINLETKKVKKTRKKRVFSEKNEKKGRKKGGLFSVIKSHLFRVQIRGSRFVTAKKGVKKVKKRAQKTRNYRKKGPRLRFGFRNGPIYRFWGSRGRFGRTGFWGRFGRNETGKRGPKKRRESSFSQENYKSSLFRAVLDGN